VADLGRDAVFHTVFCIPFLHLHLHTEVGSEVAKIRSSQEETVDPFRALKSFILGMWTPIWVWAEEFNSKSTKKTLAPKVYENIVQKRKGGRNGLIQLSVSSRQTGVGSCLSANYLLALFSLAFLFPPVSFFFQVPGSCPLV